LALASGGQVKGVTRQKVLGVSCLEKDKGGLAQNIVPLGVDREGGFLKPEGFLKKCPLFLPVLGLGNAGCSLEVKGCYRTKKKGEDDGNGECLGRQEGGHPGVGAMMRRYLSRS